MSRSAPPLRPVLAALLLCSALAVALALAPQALASGALPWLAPGQQANATANATPAVIPPAIPPVIPDDAAGLAQFEVLRQYFRWQITLDERFPQVFSRRVRDGERMAFLAMTEQQRRRGLLERFRAAKVDLEGLVFTRVTNDPDLARIRVTGRFTFSVPPVLETVEEDALFVLVPEMGEWKIFERREGWRP